MVLYLNDHINTNLRYECIKAKNCILEICNLESLLSNRQELNVLIHNCLSNEMSRKEVVWTLQVVSPPVSHTELNSEFLRNEESGLASEAN